MSAQSVVTIVDTGECIKCNGCSDCGESSGSGEHFADSKRDKEQLWSHKNVKTGTLVRTQTEGGNMEDFGQINSPIEKKKNPFKQPSAASSSVVEPQSLKNSEKALWLSGKKIPRSLG